MKKTNDKEEIIEKNEEIQEEKIKNKKVKTEKNKKENDKETVEVNNDKEVDEKDKNSKKDYLEKFQNFIAEKRKLPKEIKEKLSKKVFYNLVMAIIIMIGLILINVVYFKFNSEEFTLIAKITSMVLIITDIIIFEIAYKKDSGTYTITGIEMLILSIIILFIPRAYFYETYNTKLFLMSSSIIFAIYYVIKCMIVYKKYNIDHINQISDVKEIVKEEKEERRRRV